MQAYESKLFNMLVTDIERLRGENKDRALDRYADVNFYHAAVAREKAFVEILAIMAETKEKLDKQ